MKYSIILMPIIIVLSHTSCKATKDKNAVPTITKNTSDEIIQVKEAPPKGPIINVTDTVEIKRILLCTRDSAATREGMNLKLNTIFQKKIPDAIALSKLKITGEYIVWYKVKTPPYFFEAGITVDKVPSKLLKGMFMSKTGGDSALVAHFFGPTELTTVGYETLQDMQKEHKRKNASAPYEVYVDNKFLLVNAQRDAYKMQTDIIMPYK
jgi:hypothetical protein